MDFKGGGGQSVLTVVCPTTSPKTKLIQILISFVKKGIAQDYLFAFGDFIIFYIGQAETKQTHNTAFLLTALRILITFSKRIYSELNSITVSNKKNVMPNVVKKHKFLSTAVS